MQNTFFASGEPPYVRTVWERRFALICLRPSLPTARSRASNRYIEKEADPLKQNTICYVAEVDSQVVGVIGLELLKDETVESLCSAYSIFRKNPAMVF